MTIFIISLVWKIGGYYGIMALTRVVPHPPYELSGHDNWKALDVFFSCLAQTLTTVYSPFDQPSMPWVKIKFTESEKWWFGSFLFFGSKTVFEAKYREYNMTVVYGELQDIIAKLVEI